MLRIKFFEKFANDEPFLVVLGDKDDLRHAYEFLRNQKEAYLNDAMITEFADIGALNEDVLALTISECQAIAKHCRNLSKADKPGHAYFDTKALGKEIEGIISFGEYDDLF